MINILVTGSNGQLGSELKEISSKYSYKFFFTNRDYLDITNKQKILNFIKINKIFVIINCAAYTEVDKAQSQKELANNINNEAVKNLATISKEQNIKLIHISSDYVFDGKNYKPYIETDNRDPSNVYGSTKLAGELAMQKTNPSNSIIIRTSWVYSSFGSNFVKTMLRLGNERDELGVIFDQIGTPTYARDLAKTILEIIPQINNLNAEIYHYSNEGVLSWYDFAKEIMKMAKKGCSINPIMIKDYPTPASRPHYSFLNKTKIKQKFNIEIPFWKDSLDECLKVLGERK
ncbi:dTDP-4-dehydrorhamnose reductase [Sulfurimonas sp.]|uniref:dTDP-4-dehydrorhamnose reductase n=1 Tax=Sulfurimonas sp. TaxID=2022749 RepID=UPI0025D15320|nr:dTDP-4-dehydrorhamnose reductase [Sulfurimonas sp.]